MFKILGGDGKEYGPVTAEQIKQWIGEGRANHATMAKAEGDISWKPLAQYPEFAEVLGVKPPELTAGAAPVPVVPAPATPATPVAPAPAGAITASNDARARALNDVNGPAIGLLVTAILGMAFNAVLLVLHLIGQGYVSPMYGMNPDMTRVIHMMNGPMGIVTRVFPLAIGILVLIGALKMQKLASHGLAVTAAILAMIPCFSPCCLLGLPFGIWALVVLSRPEVRAQFDR